MAIVRLLLSPKLTPPWTIKGSVTLTRRLFSSSLEDGRKHESLSESNKEIGQKGVYWYSLGGLLTNLKEKITGNLNKTSGQDSISPKATVVSPEDVVPVTKVVSLQDVSDNKSFISPSIKEETLVSEMASRDISHSVSGVDTYGEKESVSDNKSFISPSIKNESFVSEMGSQDASQSVTGTDTYGERESTYVYKEKLDDSNSLEVFRLIPSSKDVSLRFRTQEASENQGNLKPDNGQSDKKKPSQKKLSNMFIDMFPNKEDSYTIRGSQSNMANQQGLFGKMLSDHICKIENISKENEEHMFSDSPQSPESLSSFLLSNASHDEKNGYLDAIREKKSSLSFETSNKTYVVPLEVSRDLGMKKLMDSLQCPDEYNGTVVADTNLSKHNSGDLVTKKSEEESKEEALVMQNQSLCAHASLASTTAKSLAKLSAGEEHRSNTIMLRFLKEPVERNFIVVAFSQLGDVTDVQEIPSSQGCIFKDALVTFKTNSAVKKALNKAYMMVNNQNVVMEATCKEDMVEKISIPNLIGDPDVPIGLVKEPNRTVKIHPLASDINLDQIKEALSFCRSDISKLIFGSSKTAVFVEFETEDGKERALAAHSFSILNKRSFISRIDTPRTTVARILNMSASSKRDIYKLCSPYGKIKQVITRGVSVVDVYFDVSVWPNMVTVLNSLNGKEIDGMKWVARPASSIIPPVILKALWEDPKEKRFVKRMIQNMVREIEKPLETSLSYTLVTDLLQ
ncbi:unnamed protein product [Cochlearia groenlandica]